MIEFSMITMVKFSKSLIFTHVPMKKKIQSLIDEFHFVPLPVEGTLFSSTWRSDEEFPDGSPLGTAMIGMYCHDPLSQSVFHRLPVDEIWHFYAGDAFRLVLLFPDGSSRDVIMGNKPLGGQEIQFRVPAGTWQAGHLLDGGEYALFGCTLAPGFTGKMYEGGQREELLQKYPERSQDIFRLTLEDNSTLMPEGFAN
jgi:predicted cupin superfamily sugar epimerase